MWSRAAAICTTAKVVTIATMTTVTTICTIVKPRSPRRPTFELVLFFKAISRLLEYFRLAGPQTYGAGAHAWAKLVPLALTAEMARSEGTEAARARARRHLT